jgi:hypothetical protein
VRHWRDAGHDVTRPQARRELVRVVKNDHVIDGQAKRRGDRPGRSQRALKLRWLHPADLLLATARRDSDGSDGSASVRQIHNEI